MATQLASQLQKLRENGSGSRRRIVSFLHEPKEAARIDDELVYNMACNGLLELQRLDSRFEHFLPESSVCSEQHMALSALFSRQQLRLHRAHLSPAEDSELNEKLDILFNALGGYFLLNATHKVLEFLLRKYEVHRYNVEAIMKMILCYHESPFFSRLVRLLHIRSTQWEFLLPVRNLKESIDVSTNFVVVRDVLIHRALNDPSFVESIFDAIQPAKMPTDDMELPSQLLLVPSNQSKMIGLYTAIVLGMLEQARVISESTLRWLLPQILKATRSASHPQLQAAAYMILSKASSRAPMASLALKSLVGQIIMSQFACSDLVKFSGLRTASTELNAMICLVSLAQSQSHFVLDGKALRYLTESPRLGSLVARVADQYEAIAFVRVLIFSFLDNLVSQKIPKEQNVFSNALRDLLMALPPQVIAPLVHDLIKSLLQSAVAAHFRASNPLMKNISTLLKTLSRDFLNELDSCVQDILLSFQNKDGGSVTIENDKKAARAFLAETFASAPNSAHFIPFSVSQGNEHTKIVEGATSLGLALDHTNPLIRYDAVKSLIEEEKGQDEKCPTSAKTLTGDVLVRRLQDDYLPIVYLMTSSPMLIELILHTSHSKLILRNALPRIKQLMLSLDVFEPLESKANVETLDSAATIQQTLQSMLQFITSHFAVFTNHEFDGEITRYLLSYVSQCFLRNEAKAPLNALLPYLFHSLKQLKHPFVDDLGTPQNNDWKSFVEVLANALANNVSKHLSFCQSWGNSVESTVQYDYLLDCSPFPRLLIKVLALARKTELKTSDKKALGLAFHDTVINEFMIACANPHAIEDDVVTSLASHVCDILEELFQQDKLNSFMSCIFVLQSSPLPIYLLIRKQIRGLFRRNSRLQEALIPTVSRIVSTLVPLPCASSLQLSKNDHLLLMQLASLRSLEMLSRTFRKAEPTKKAQAREMVQIMPHILPALASEHLVHRKAAIACLDAWRESVTKCATKHKKSLEELFACHAAVNYLLEAKEDISMDMEMCRRLLKEFNRVNAIAASKFFSFLLKFACNVCQKELDSGRKVLMLLHEIRSPELWLESIEYFESALAKLKQQKDDATELSSLLLAHYMYVSGSSWTPFLKVIHAVLKANASSNSAQALQQVVLQHFTLGFYQSLNPTTQNKMLQSIFDLSQSSPQVLLTSSAIHALKKLPLSWDYCCLFIRKILTKKPYVSRMESFLEIVSVQLETFARNPTKHASFQHIRNLFGALRDVVLSAVSANEQEGTSSEYMLQICFMCLCELCGIATKPVKENFQTLSLRNKKKTTTLNVEQEALDLVQGAISCVQRSNGSPQTRNQVLLFISALVHVDPKSVLKTIRVIIGSKSSENNCLAAFESCDEYSFQVAEKIISSISPYIVRSDENRDGESIGIIDSLSFVRIFASAFESVPAHRREPLLRCLTRSFGKSYLPHVIVALIEEALHQTAPHALAVRIMCDHRLLETWNIHEQMETMLHILDILKKLPHFTKESENEIDDEEEEEVMDAEAILPNYSFLLETIESVERSRQLQLLMTDFISEHLMSESFRCKILELEESLEKMEIDEEQPNIQHIYLNLVEKVLLQLRRVNREHVRAEKHSAREFWSSYQIRLINIISSLEKLLSTPSFIALIGELLHHDSSEIRKKAMQLLNSRLQDERTMMSPSEEILYVEMLADLEQVLVNKSPEPQVSESSSETWANVQAALLSIDILTRTFAAEDIYRAQFQGIMKSIVAHVNVDIKDWICDYSQHMQQLQVIGCAFVCLASNCNAIGPLMLPSLPTFYPRLLDGIQVLAGEDSVTGTAPFQAHAALHTVLQCFLNACKSFTSNLLPFLSPYLSRTVQCLILPPLSSVSLASQRSKDNEQLHSSVLVCLKNISEQTELRILLPALFDSVLPVVLSAQKDSSMLELLSLVSAVTARMSTTDVSQFFAAFVKFYVSMMDVRRGNEMQIIRFVDIDAVESKMLNCFVQFVLKLNEKQLKPLIPKLADWANANVGGEDFRRMTLYRLMFKLTEQLRGILVPYFAHVWQILIQNLQETCQILCGHDSEDVDSDEDNFFVEDKPSVLMPSKKRRLINGCASTDDIEQVSAVCLTKHQNLDLLRCSVEALNACFVHDQSQEFIDPERFHAAMTPLVDTFDILAVSDADTPLDERKTLVYDHVVHSLVNLAYAAKSDLLWKPMHYAVLMKSRCQNAFIRLASLKTIERCYRVIGDEFLVMLPESLPFLSELLEDNDEQVQKTCHHVIKSIENMSGESLDQYMAS